MSSLTPIEARICHLRGQIDGLLGCIQNTKDVSLKFNDPAYFDKRKDEYMDLLLGIYGELTEARKLHEAEIRGF